MFPINVRKNVHIFNMIYMAPKRPECHLALLFPKFSRGACPPTPLEQLPAFTARQ